MSKKLISNKSLPLIFLGIIIGVSLSLVFDRWRENQTKHFVDQQLTFLKSSQWQTLDKAFRHQDDVQKDKRKALIEDLMSLGNLKNYKISFSDVALKYIKQDGFCRYATIDADASFENGQAELSFQLIHQDSGWKFDRITIANHALKHELVILK